MIKSIAVYGASIGTTYICATMRLFLLYILIFCQLSFSSAQNDVWVNVKDLTSGVAVKMPQLPKYDQEELFSEDGTIIKEIFSTRHNEVDMYFEIQPISGEGKKVQEEAINKAFQLIAIQNQGNPGKKQKLKKNGFPYQYIEIPLVTGKLIRSVAFVYNNRLFHIYMKGSINTVFDIDANFYLASWSLPQLVETTATDTNTEITSEENDLPIQLNWFSVPIDDQIFVEFPGKPFKKENFIEKGKNDIRITTYTYTDLDNRLNYVATKRTYNNDEGQLTDEALFTFLTDRVVAGKNLKKLNTLPSENGQQYIFSKGIRFYRLKLLRVEDTLYQFLVKGKRKSIYSPQVEYFFEHTNPAL
ncbi:MAG: hypothetical protein R2730_08545 [Chitinophagales bacterium]